MAFDPDAYLAKKAAPAGFDPDAYLAKKAAQQEAAPNPTEGMSGGELALAGAGKFMVDTVVGAKQAQLGMAGAAADPGNTPLKYLPPVQIAQLIAGGDQSGLLEYFPPIAASKWLAEKVYGNKDEIQAKQAQMQAEIDATRAQDAPLMETGAGKAGYLGGALATGIALPGGAGLVGRAAVGGATAGLQPVATGESRAANAAIGATAGALLPPAIGYGGRKLAEGAAKVAPKATAAIGSTLGKVSESYRTSMNAVNDRLINTVMGRNTGTVAPQLAAAADDLAQAAQQGAVKAGVNWDELDDALKVGILKNVQDAAELGSDLPPEALVRKAVYESQGITPTRALITRDFTDNLNEQNLMGMDEGKALRDVYVKNNAAIRENVRKMAPPGTKAVDQPSFGAQFRAPVESKERLAQEATNQIYKVADLLEGGRKVKPQELVGYLRQNTDMLNASDAGKQVTAYLQKSGILDKSGKPRLEYKIDPLMGGKREAPELTLRQVSGLRKVVNDAWSSSQGPARAQLNEMRQLLNGMVDEAGGDMFKMYNKLRTAKGQAFENNPLIDKLLSDKKGYYGTDFIEDSEVFNKVVMNSTPEQFGKLYQHVDKAGKDLTKAQLAKHIEDQVFGNLGTNEAGDVVASAAKLNRAVEKIGYPKLKMIMGEEDAQGIILLNKTLREISNPPSGTKPQGSAPRLVFMQKTILQALRKAGKLPLIGDMAEAGIAAAERGAASRAAKQGVEAALDPLKPFRDEVAKRAKETARAASDRSLGRLGTAAALGATASRDQSSR